MILAKDVVNAYDVLKGVVERTPLDFDRYLSEKYGATVYLKRENMQKVRSFKIRGAYYAIHELSDEEKNVVWFVLLLETMHKVLLLLVTK